MKALTLWPEWAAAIVHLGKDVENRSWEPPKALIGQRIAIHAGAYIGGRRSASALFGGAIALEQTARTAGEQVRVMLPAKSASGYAWSPRRVDWSRPARLVRVPSGATFPIVTRAIVATTILAEVRRDSPSPWAAPGAFHWCLADVEVLGRPVVCSGRQGLWNAHDAPEVTDAR